MFLHDTKILFVCIVHIIFANFLLHVLDDRIIIEDMHCLESILYLYH